MNSLVGKPNRDHVALQRSQRQWSHDDLRNRLIHISAMPVNRRSDEDHNFVASILNYAFSRSNKKYIDLTGTIVVNFSDQLCVEFESGKTKSIKSKNIVLESRNFSYYVNIVEIEGMLFELFYNEDHIVARRLTDTAFRKAVQLKGDSSENAHAPDLISRWAEQNRPTKQINLRLDPDLLRRVEEAASASGRNRTEFITQALKIALRPKP